MKLKTSPSIYFLDSITPEQEYFLINESINKLKDKINTANGKLLLFSDFKLLKKNNIEYIDLKYNKKNQNTFCIFMMLISAYPFQNFLIEIDQIERFPILHNMKSIYNKILTKQSVDIEKFINFEECYDLKEGYSLILKNIHQELCKYYYFDENTWTSHKKGKALKYIFNEYSPIVEIFHGKILENFAGLNLGFFDFINIENNPKVILSNKKGTKLPYVILVKISEFLLIENYIASSIIVEEDNVFNIIINSNNTWYKYHIDRFEIVQDVENMKNIRYIIFSKEN